MGAKDAMRIENWETELYSYLEASKSLQFEWGVNDCALWASSFVDKITGSAFADNWRGLYNDEDGANALMAGRGFANCEAVADSLAESKPVKRAGRGDIVLHPSGALGICDGRKSYFLTPDKGLAAILTVSCKKAWKV